MAQVDIDGGPVLYACWFGQRGTRDLFQDPGGVLTLEPNRVNSPLDKFYFTSKKQTYVKATAKVDVKKINVFPNPYYGSHQNELSLQNRYVTFNHLPPQAPFKIFDLAGNFVVKIEKDNESQYAQWDLLNHNGLPVASGIYIVYIDMPDLGTSKILKLALVREREFIQYY